MPLDLSIGQGSTPLANQVAGHQNVMSDASGSLIMKPALPREIAFYQLLNSASRSSQLTKLKPFVPQFFGTLRLEGKLDDQGALSQDGIPEEVPESVVLQNLAHLYTHPSILDVKLGTILYAPDAKEEKKARMEKQAKTSTTWETGLRLTGCQTWHTPTSSYILTPKSYGKTITKDELPQGITRFFPLPTDSIPSLVFATSPPPTSTETVSGAPISHLPLPSSELSPLQPTTPGPTDSDGPKEYTGHGIRPKLLLRLLRHINSDLIKLEAILHDLEARFIGSSILVVYEGDPERLEDALERHEAKQAALEVLAQSETESLEDEDDITEDEDESSTSSDDDEHDGVRADARRARRCPPFTLKMIDFAHTSLVEGEGPDEGVLKGISTLKKLIQTRIDQVEAVV